MKKYPSYFFVLLKDFGALFGYTLLCLIMMGCSEYLLFAVGHWNLNITGFGEKDALDSLFFKAADTIVLLTFYAKRRTLNLNYNRILSLKPAKFLKANQGIGFAALAIFFITGLMIALGAVHLAYNPAYSMAEISIYFLLFILVGINEEFLMRGIWTEYLLKRHSKVTAVAISSGVFAVLHLFNPDVTSLSFFNLILAGVLLSQLYMLTKNIWLAALFHLGWNFFQGPVLGFSVSGLPMHSIFIQPYKPIDNVINGGAFGLEGSVITTVVLLGITAWLGMQLKCNNLKKALLQVRSNP